MPLDLQGKSAIVTGAGGGINLAFTKKLLAAGVNVLIADLYLTKEAEEVVEQYKDKPRVVFQKTDVSSWSDLETMFKTALEHFGQIDIVCPGAGVFEPNWTNFWFPPGSSESKDDPKGNSYKTLDINLTHPIRVAQMAISLFLSGTGTTGPATPKRLVFIASIAGEISLLGTPLYHASKWGILGFLYSIAALEEFTGIKVGGVCPGLVNTRLWTEDELKMLMMRDPESGEIAPDAWVTVDEVADALMALVKDDETDDGKGGKIPIKSGTVLEVGAGYLRDVPMLGNAGPDFAAPGMKLANVGGVYEKVIGQLHTPGWGKF